MYVYDVPGMYVVPKVLMPLYVVEDQSSRRIRSIALKDQIYRGAGPAFYLNHPSSSHYHLREWKFPSSAAYYLCTC